MISNEPVQPQKIERAQRIIRAMQEELRSAIKAGTGPFLAAVYTAQGELVVQAANSVLNTTCSHCHAEMNAIQAAEKAYNTYDLAPYQLSLYVTAEPCIMCLGGILWSGIKEIYYGVSSKQVELITGFDEGFKPNWLEEFKKRGITVYGELETALGEDVLREYMAQNRVVYKPSR